MTQEVPLTTHTHTHLTADMWYLRSGAHLSLVISMIALPLAFSTQSLLYIQFPINAPVSVLLRSYTRFFSNTFFFYNYNVCRLNIICQPGAHEWQTHQGSSETGRRGQPYLSEGTLREQWDRPQRTLSLRRIELQPTYNTRYPTVPLLSYKNVFIMMLGTISPIPSIIRQVWGPCSDSSRRW